MIISIVGTLPDGTKIPNGCKKCPSCQGSGTKTFGSKCFKCLGNGYVRG